jgi:hypothetical protein
LNSFSLSCFVRLNSFCDYLICVSRRHTKTFHFEKLTNTKIPLVCSAPQFSKIYTYISIVCEWAFITCDDSSPTPNVIAVTISSANLVGTTIPTELGQLSHLRELIISNAGLQGSFPQELVDHATSLEVINLSHNELTGHIPVFSSSPNLILQDMSHNQLTGTIPKGLLVGGGGDIIGPGTPKLTAVLLAFNRLTGRIPNFDLTVGATPTTTTVLRTLDLSSNRLSGSLPTTGLQSLVGLEQLAVANNRLTGSIPEGLFTADMVSLSELLINGNEIVGTLPISLADLPQLKVLLVDHNRLTGQVPMELCQLNLNEALFDGSKDSMEITLLDQTYEDVYGYYSGGSRRAHHWRRMERRRRDLQTTTETRNGCTSISCPAGSMGSASTGHKRGVFPCQPCESQGTANPYLGAPSCLSYNQDDILQSLFDETNGNTWTLNGEERQTWIDPSISDCAKTGISCDAKGSVIRIVLEHRNLTGTLPPSLGFLPDLIELDVSDNALQGTVPEELALPPLLLLDLAETQLTGTIPSALCRKEKVNGNGQDGILNCDVIACPTYTYHPEGRADAGLNGALFCKPCDLSDSGRLGRTSCAPPPIAIDDAAWIDLFMMVALAAGILFGGFFVWRQSGATRTFFQGRYSMATSSSTQQGTSGSTRNDDYDDDDTQIPVRLTSIVRPKFTVLDPYSANLDIRVQDEWANKKEVNQEVWMDVPTIR